MDLTTKKANSILEAIKKDLEKSIKDADFMNWILPLGFSCDIKTRKIYLSGPDQYFNAWVKTHFLSMIQGAFSKTVLKEFEICQTLHSLESSPQEEIKPLSIKLRDDLLAAMKQPQQLFLDGFMPTHLCRTTFFRPIPRKNLRPASEGRDHPPIETPWASLTWHGPDCGIKEEDVLIYITYKWVKNGQKPFRCTYRELLDGLGYKKSKQGKHYTNNIVALKDHIDRLQKTSFKLIIKKGSPHVTSGGGAHILTYTLDDKDGCMVFDINTDFGRLVGAGLITGLKSRGLLEKDISKAMHRFICSHGADGHYPLFDVAQYIGMDLTRPTETVRRMIRLALGELKKIGFITSKSKIVNDIVHWYLTEIPQSGPGLLESVKK